MTISVCKAWDNGEVIRFWWWSNNLPNNAENVLAEVCALRTLLIRIKSPVVNEILFIKDLKKPQRHKQSSVNDATGPL